jgi:hypothetical protein
MTQVRMKVKLVNNSTYGSKYKQVIGGVCIKGFIFSFLKIITIFKGILYEEALR